MGSYSFKSVGQTNEQRVAEMPVTSSLPVGIKTPLELGTTDGILKMHHDLADVVHDNLKNLIMTNWGERIFQYAFGANLRPLVAEWSTLDEFDSQAYERIKNTVTQWMSYVSLEGYFSRIDTTQRTGTVVRVTITYNVPTLNVNTRGLEIAFRVM